MTAFFNEQFEGTSGNTLSAYSQAWVKMVGHTGNISILDGTARHTSSTTVAGFYRNDTPAPGLDYSVSADLKITAAIGTANMSIAGWVSSTANTLYYARIAASAGVSIVKIVANTQTVLASAPAAFATGATYRLRLERIGNQLAAYLDDVLMVSVTDSSITAPGFIGLRSVNANNVVAVDNLIADDGQSSSSTTTVSPAPGALVVTGYAPSIAQTANQDVSPAPAALTVTGYAPTVTQSSANSISPTPAALVVEGFAPTISQTQRLTVSPAPAGLIVQGWAPTITQTGKQPDPEIGPAPGGGGGGGSIREVRAFAEELDRARKPTRAEKKRRRQAIETAVLELLPDVPAAERAAPVIAQLVARELPPATWAPIYGPRPVVLPTAVVDDVHARVAEWLAEQAHQALLAELEDDFEVELLLLG